MSSVVAIFASSAGFRWVTPVTSVPSRTVFVSRARAFRTDQPSSIGSSSEPTPAIWDRGSITVTRAKPFDSAACACSTTRSKSSADEAVGYVYRGRCSPIHGFIGRAYPGPPLDDGDHPLDRVISHEPAVDEHADEVAEGK